MCRGKKNRDTEGPIKTLSSRYIKDIMDALSSLFLRYRPNDLPKFPVFDVEPAVQKQILGVQREMALMDKIPQRHGYRLAIEILLQTGMHINEVRAQRRGDLVDGVIIVNKAIADDGRTKYKRKSGGEVFAKVTTDLWNRLQEHVQGKKSSDLIFTIDGDNPLGEGRLYKVLQKACADAGVEPISLQMASRHSTATRIKRKHDEEAYAEIEETLGHENRNTGKEHYIVPPTFTKN
jgi:integrase